MRVVNGLAELDQVVLFGGEGKFGVELECVNGRLGHVGEDKHEARCPEVVHVIEGRLIGDVCLAECSHALWSEDAGGILLILEEHDGLDRMGG